MEKIDKKKVLELLGDLDADMPDDTYNYLVTKINALPTYTDEWISVSERYPESGVTVLCLNEYGYFKVGTFYHEHKHFAGDDSYNGITHWQSLPQPPTK